MKKKVIVGLSGGVDSSVTSYLLKEQGYEVIGMTMRTWDDSKDDILSQSSDELIINDAKRVAQAIGIEHYVVDFHEEFRKEVINYFIDEYKNARTPNPCVVCNRAIKWKALFTAAEKFGADYVATGHYAKIEQLENGRYVIKNSKTAQKDQTYALYNLTQEQLQKTLLPLGEYEKTRIREIAEEVNIPVADKKDSQDICFIKDGDYASFIEKETKQSFGKGNFVDLNGNVLGEHKGIIHYTIGQRKGLGITAATPLFVKEIRPETNEVVVCQSDDLFSKVCYVENVNFMAISNLTGPYNTIGKIRYSHKGSECIIEPVTDSKIKCTFNEPQRAFTPGQSAVFYEDGHVLCGGTIVLQ